MSSPIVIAATPYTWPHDGRLDPRRTALLIIDMQKDFCSVGGYVDSMGVDIEPTRVLVPAISRVSEAVRAWGGLIVYTREGHRPDLSDLHPLKRWRSRQAGPGIGSTGPLGRLLVRGEPGWDIVDELKPQQHDVLVDKPGYGAFSNTDLSQILGARGVSHLIITGVTTDVCVHSTLREAVDRGYECLTVSDCCAATDPANHVAALNTIATEGGIFGAVAISDAVVSALG